MDMSFWNSSFGFFDICFHKLSSNCCFVLKLLYIFSQKTKSFQSPWDDEKDPNKPTIGNGEYYELFSLQRCYQLKNYFLMGIILINLLNKYYVLECVPKSAYLWDVLASFWSHWNTGLLRSSSFQNGSEYFTTGNWKHQKSHRETFPFW